MTLLSEVWTQTLGWTLVHSFWLITLIALSLRLLLWLIPRRASRFRYLISVGVLMITLGSLVVTGYQVHQPQTSSSAPKTLVSEHLRAPTSHLGVVQAPPTETWIDRATEISGQLQVWLSPHLSGVLVLWFSGMFFFLFRTVGKVVYLHRLTRQDSHPLPQNVHIAIDKLKEVLKIKRNVIVRTSARIRTPFVAGWFKPVILLPASSLSQLSYEQLEAILAHELAHIQRWDDVVNWFQTVIEIVLFYHPAIWWISQIIRDERERCCDDLAVSACGNPLVYAKALAQMETLQQSASELALAFARQGAGLLARIERLLQPSTSSSQPSIAPAIIAGLLLLSFLISYRMSALHTSDTPSETTYSGAILSIPPIKDSETQTSLSPWQPKLPDWLMEKERLTLDTVPDNDTIPETDEKKNRRYRVHISPDDWEIDINLDNDLDIDIDNDFDINMDHDFDIDTNIDIDTSSSLIWSDSHPKVFAFKSHKFDDEDMSTFKIAIDTGIVWKIDTAFRYQFHMADTLFPPGVFDIPMPPMPNMPALPDSLVDFSFDFYEDAFENYEQLFDHLDSTGFWDQMMEQQEEQLREQQERLEEQLEERKALQEERLQEWQQRLEEWEERQQEQIQQYEERVRDWEERARERWERSQERLEERRQRENTLRESLNHLREQQVVAQNQFNSKRQEANLKFQHLLEELAELTR